MKDDEAKTRLAEAMEKPPVKLREGERSMALFPSDKLEEQDNIPWCSPEELVAELRRFPGVEMAEVNEKGLFFRTPDHWTDDANQAVYNLCIQTCWIRNGRPLCKDVPTE